MIENPELGDQIAALIADMEGQARVASLVRLSGGMSREAWTLDVDVPDGQAWQRRACVMLRSADASLIESGLEAEAALLSALEPAGLPIPKIVWADISGDRVQRPAVIMERIPGSSEPRELGRLDTATRRRIEDQFVAFLARLHEVPLDALPFPDIAAAEVAAVQVKRWSSLLVAEDYASFPALAEVVRWLETRTPVPTRVSLVHGDFRYGNLLFDQTGLTGVLDWELAHLGDPVEDLVWAYRPFRAGTAPQRPLHELVSDYAQLAGADVPWSSISYYRVFSEFKTAVIYLTGVHMRAAAGVADLGPWIPSQLIACCLRQALYWIDEQEAQAC